MNQARKLSVIIPIKEEQDNLRPLHERLTAALKERPTEARIKAAERLRERLREERQEGLEDEGEMSEENIAFKVYYKGKTDLRALRAGG